MSNYPHEDEFDFFDESDLPADDITNEDGAGAQEDSEEKLQEEALVDDTDLYAEDENNDGEEEENVPAPRSYKVRVNHQDIEVPETEALVYIQKGADYDRVKGQVESFKSDPRLLFVENLAKQNGMSVDDYLSAYNEVQKRNEYQELLDQGIPEQAAKELVEARRQKEADADARRKAQEVEDDQKDLLDFANYFQKVHGRMFDADTDELPADIWIAVSSGVPLKVAYMEHLLTEKKAGEQNDAKRQALELQKEKVRGRAPIKSASTYGNGKSPKRDKDLIGLWDEE